MEKPQTLKGFRDFLPSDMAVRNRVRKILVDVFESFGFEPLTTPAVEYASVLLGKYGSEADRLVYTFDDRGGRKVGLRYDLTVPTARVVAQHSNELSTPFKRYQMQPVWRAENTQKGRYREFEQCDVDIFGTTSPFSDAEIIAVIENASSRLGLGSFQILFNSRALLFAIMKSAGIEEEKLKEAAISIDKLDKISEEEVKAEMKEKRKIPSSAVDRLFEITNALSKAYPTAEALVEKSELTEEVPEEEFTALQEIAKAAIQMGVDPQVLTPRFTLARGLDYYTGVIFETVVTEPKIGSICGGGRYDKLIETLGGPPTPAVGVAFGFDRICDVINELNLWTDILPTTTQVLVTIFSEEYAPESVKVAKLLRESGINADVYVNDAKLDKQLKYADKKGIPWVVIIGEKEAKSGTLILKNLKNGEQEEIAVHDIAGKIRG